MKNLVILSTILTLVVTACENDTTTNTPKEPQKTKAELYQDSVDSYQQSMMTYKDSIQIVKSYTKEPNSAGGVDCNIVFKNTSNRTLKYVRFQAIPINAVGDQVACEIYGMKTKGLKVTGPIKPNQVNGYGEYWDTAWYNYSIRSMKVVSFELEYMDGTIVEVTL